MMIKERTFLDIASSNLEAARIIIEHSSEDEEYLNITGYHLQQCVLFIIKYLFEQHEFECLDSKYIDQLIRIAHENNIDLFLSEYIEDHAEMFSAWESKSRYVIGYSIEANKANRALTEVDKYLTTVAKALQ